MLYDIVTLPKDGRYLLGRVLIPVKSYTVFRSEGMETSQSLKVGCGAS